MRPRALRTLPRIREVCPRASALFFFENQNSELVRAGRAGKGVCYRAVGGVWGPRWILIPAICSSEYPAARAAIVALALAASSSSRRFSCVVVVVVAVMVVMVVMVVVVALVVVAVVVAVVMVVVVVVVVVAALVVTAAAAAAATVVVVVVSASASTAAAAVDGVRRCGVSDMVAQPNPPAAPLSRHHGTRSDPSSRTWWRGWRGGVGRGAWHWAWGGHRRAWCGLHVVAAGASPANMWPCRRQRVLSYPTYGTTTSRGRNFV